ncbi:MAG: hypothetical protein M1829_006890 [Trizodia sp. TS-e1964]|nr:MAG: hypothetical protein M1829_006890 [Trizodia sp. TS-e1964]
MPATSVKRACDACHRRKVKCDGRNPCRNCSHAGLKCTFDAIPLKKGPKGSRAKVISELRETQQRHAHLAFRASDLSGSSPPLSPLAFARPMQQRILTPELVAACTDYFFQHMYPTMPILHRARLEQAIVGIYDSSETYCLVTSLCAFMMIQPGMKVPAAPPARPGEHPAHITTGVAMLEEALRVRKAYEYIESPTLATVITSFFFFACFFGLDKHNTAWFHLREATTLSQILGLQDEASYKSLDFIESSRRRRTFWLLFVTERAYALQRHRPLTLHPTINLPRSDEDATEPTLAITGFLYLVGLFAPFDDVFVALWNKARSDCSTSWLAQLQHQLAEALPATLQSTETQVADLRTSQQWLRTMVWQLSISNGFLSSSSPDSSMTFKYPIEIARDLVMVTGRLSQQSMEVHGIGLIEKLFDVACTLTDVIACVPINTPSIEIGPRDYLNQVVALISTLRGGESRFLPLLLQKVSDTLPELAAPIVRKPLQLDCSRIDRRIEEVFDDSSPSVDSPQSAAYLSPTMASPLPFSNSLPTPTSQPRANMPPEAPYTGRVGGVAGTRNLPPMAGLNGLTPFAGLVTSNEQFHSLYQTAGYA